jgi:hypothetical protein
LEAVSQAIAPTSVEIKHRALFNYHYYEFYETEDYQAEDRQLAERRKVALAEVRKAVGLRGIIVFARGVLFPYEVGITLGGIADAESDVALLPGLLEGDVHELVRGYIISRFHLIGMAWLSTLNFTEWSPGQIGLFFSTLPFEPAVWAKAESLLKDAPREYWDRIQVRSRGTPAELEAAMRHSDLKLTTNMYTDASQLPMAKGVAALPQLPAITDDGRIRRFHKHGPRASSSETRVVDPGALPKLPTITEKSKIHGTQIGAHIGAQTGVAAGREQSAPVALGHSVAITQTADSVAVGHEKLRQSATIRVS